MRRKNQPLQSIDTTPLGARAGARARLRGGVRRRFGSCIGQFAKFDGGHYGSAVPPLSTLRARADMANRHNALPMSIV